MNNKPIIIGSLDATDPIIVLSKELKEVKEKYEKLLIFTKECSEWSHFLAIQARNLLKEIEEIEE